MTTTGAPRPPRSRRAVALALTVAAALTAAVVLVAALALRSGTPQERGDAAGPLAGDATQPPRTRTPAPGEPPFLAAVSDDGRYFVDQYSEPFLVRGDSPWSLMTDLSPEQADLYFANRRENGFNASIVSLLGAVDNGAPSDDGATFDGVLPFDDGDITAWNEEYWARVETVVRTAAEHGNTLFLYPTDGWVMSTIFADTSLEDCFAYGAMVAERFADYPNIVWMAGGDYFPLTNSPEVGSTHDLRITAVLNGIRSTGDERPFSIQLGYEKSLSTDNPYWADRVDWNFVYTYYPTYKAVLEAYAHEPAMPALFAEGGYEGGPNMQGTGPRTDETLRRQALWALTSGSPGDFYGSLDWEFHEGWQSRLDSVAVAQLKLLRDLVASLPWWNMVPTIDDSVLTGGRGTKVESDERLDPLESDYATSTFSPDRRHGVIYAPTSRTLSLDMTSFPSEVNTYWFDPSNGAVSNAGLGPRFTTPGANAAGDEDWLLLITTLPRDNFAIPSNPPY